MAQLPGCEQSAVQWGQNGGPNVFEGTVVPGGVGIFMPYQNTQSCSGNGIRFDDCSLLVQTRGHQFCLAVTDWDRWFSLLLPDKLIADWNLTATKSIGSASGFIQLSVDRAKEFRRALAQLGLIVSRAPLAFESSAAVNATTHKLTELVREVLGGSRVVTSKPGRHSVSRKEIVHSVMNFIEQHDCEYLAVTELATAAETAGRVR